MINALSLLLIGALGHGAPGTNVPKSPLPGPLASAAVQDLGRAPKVVQPTSKPSASGTAKAPKTPFEQLASEQSANPYGRNLREHAPWAERDRDLGLAPISSARPSPGSSSVNVVSVAAQTAQLGGQKVLFYAVTILPASGFTEVFAVFVPAQVPGPQPLLVGFHGYGFSAGDVPYNTTMLFEAKNRNWYLCAPLGGSQVNFSSTVAQVNTQAVLDFMLANFSDIDTSRIYGIGFSMGGGWALNYAARHLDPQRPMFAALVNHTGGVALKNTLLNESLPPPDYTFVQSVFDFWFGNSTQGSALPFEMARSSVVNFDATTLAVEQDQDLARNILHVPTRSVRAAGEPIAYLTTQNDVLHSHFLSLGRQVGPTYDYQVVPGTVHNWSTLNMKQACDFVGQFTLNLPTSASTLADANGKYFYFDVQQDVAGSFTRFDWTLQSAFNKLTLLSTKNLKRVTIDMTVAPLVSTSNLQLDLAAADGLADEVAVVKWPSLPTAVTRDTLPMVLGVNYTYDAPTQTLVLLETDPLQHAWIVTP